MNLESALINFRQSSVPVEKSLWISVWWRMTDYEKTEGKQKPQSIFIFDNIQSKTRNKQKQKSRTGLGVGYAQKP